MDLIKGVILKGIGGFYYVETEDAVVECHPRGVFRKKGITPVAGDYVKISLDENGKGTIETIEERKNYLVRPPVANVDYLAMVISLIHPLPNLQIVDTMLAVAESKEIDAVIVINKADMADATDIQETYEKAGYKVFVVSAKENTGINDLKQFILGKTCVFTGNTGVGKSSILNLIDESLSLETGETSLKLGRGKHTTRSSVLYPQKNGGYLIDTPGFSSLTMEKLADVDEDELQYCFREFDSYLGKCKFTSCRHVHEKGCAVCEALEQGKITLSRHESYKALLNILKSQDNYD